MLKKEIQPALKSYFFGEGYVDLAHTIKDSFINLKNAGVWLIKLIPKIWGKVPFIVFKILVMILIVPFSLLAMLSVFIFGTLIVAVLSAYHIFILLLVMIAVYIIFTFVWIADRIYLKIKKISAVCPSCKQKYLIPFYKCSNCGRMHTHLTPGKYGIFYRTCECGQKLPTTFLTGRGKNAIAICPNPNCNTILGGVQKNIGRRPICIPIVGGRSAGKTAYITAFTYLFTKEFAKKYGWNISDYDDESKGRMLDLVSTYTHGITQQTDTTSSIQGHTVSSVPVNFIVSGKKFHPDREFHIYDIAGETFRSNTDEEKALQYGYCHGIVFIIDPFAIPAVLDKYGDLLSIDRTTDATKSDVALDDLVYAFFGRMKMITGMKDNELLKVPLAIVINKIDAAGLMNELGPAAINAEVSSRGGAVNYMDAEDYLCRKFLADNGEKHILDILNNKFNVNRCFSCSAMGHTAGTEYRPLGVMEPMEWIIRREDGTFDSVWKINDLTNTPFALKNGIN